MAGTSKQGFRPRMLSTTVWEGMLGKESFAVLNAAISGQMGWRRVARAVTALRAQKPVSKSPNYISDKISRCVVCTAGSHLAYDCSALALGSLNSTADCL